MFNFTVYILFFYITLYVFIFPICLCQRSQSLFSYMDLSLKSNQIKSKVLFQYMDRPGTCIIILDKKYNIANSSCHFGSNGRIWTGPSPKKYLVTDCYMTLSAMNYLLNIKAKRIIHIRVCIRQLALFISVFNQNSSIIKTAFDYKSFNCCISI